MSELRYARRVIGFKAFDSYSADNISKEINEFLEKDWEILDSGYVPRHGMEGRHWVHMILIGIMEVN